MRFSRQVYWSGLPFPPPVDHVLSELSSMTHPSWVAIRGMAHSFIRLHKPLCHNKAVIHCQGPAPAGSRGSLRINGVSEREKTHETSLDRAKSARERERERMTRRGCLQGLAESGNALFFTVSYFLP